MADLVAAPAMALRLDEALDEARQAHPRTADAAAAEAAEAAPTEASKFAEAVRAYLRCDAACDVLAGLDLCSERVQAFVVDDLVDNAVSKRCPPRQSYVRKVVTAAIAAADRGGADISDALYERLASSMSDDTEERAPLFGEARSGGARDGSASEMAGQARTSALTSAPTVAPSAR